MSAVPTVWTPVGWSQLQEGLLQPVMSCEVLYETIVVRFYFDDTHRMDSCWLEPNARGTLVVWDVI